MFVTTKFQHKHGADELEQVHAIPSDPENRLKDVGKAREIEVHP